MFIFKKKIVTLARHPSYPHIEFSALVPRLDLENVVSAGVAGRGLHLEDVSRNGAYGHHVHVPVQDGEGLVSAASVLGGTHTAAVEKGDHVRTWPILLSCWLELLPHLKHEKEATLSLSSKCGNCRRRCSCPAFKTSPACRRALCFLENGPFWPIRYSCDWRYNPEVSGFRSTGPFSNATHVCQCV